MGMPLSFQRARSALPPQSGEESTGSRGFPQEPLVDAVGNNGTNITVEGEVRASVLALAFPEPCCRQAGAFCYSCLVENEPSCAALLGGGQRTQIPGKSDEQPSFPGV